MNIITEALESVNKIDFELLRKICVIKNVFDNHNDYIKSQIPFDIINRIYEDLVNPYPCKEGSNCDEAKKNKFVRFINSENKEEYEVIYETDKSYLILAPESCLPLDSGFTTVDVNIINKYAGQKVWFLTKNKFEEVK